MSVKHTQFHAAYFVCLDIEPWSFDQCVGEAVIVPAGCPYQNRKNKVLLLAPNTLFPSFVTTKLLIVIT